MIYSHLLSHGGQGCLTWKLSKSRYEYQCLITLSVVYLFIWGFTSLSTLYRSYHDR